MVISRWEKLGGHLKVEYYKFERIHGFKNLDVTIHGKNNNHEGIKIWTTTAYKCYYGLTSTLKWNQVSLELKITLYKSDIL